MSVSDDDIKQLLQQVRDLTARVHRVEQLLRIAPAFSSPQIRFGEGGEKLSPSASPVSSPPTPSAELRSPASEATYPPSLGRSILPDKDARNLESRIGSHWLNRIGITAVLICAAYFLKFAFDSQWIGPGGRIAIGLISGIAVVVWSERFRLKGYRLFSFSLKAVGIGVLYLSLWASFQVYHLMPGGAVFAFMFVVTAATCAMALSQDAEILAVYAIVGGFSTPVLLSTGINREIALFSYVILLDLGIFALVLFKPWRRLLWLGFGGTLILYLAWYFEYYDRKQFETTLVFASIFFLIFAIAPICMLRQEKGAGMMPLVLAFVNAVTFFLQAYVMIAEISTTAMAWFSLVLAAVYLGLNAIRPKSSDEAAEANLRLMHLALALGLITVAIPIRLESHWITIGWFVESAILLWLGSRIKSELLQIFALTALMLGVGRLVFVDNFFPRTLFFNMRMAVYAIAITVLGFVAFEAAKNAREEVNNIGRIAIVALNALALAGLTYEIRDYYARQLATGFPAPVLWAPEHWSQFRSIELARDFTYSALFMGYGAMLMVIGFLRNSAFVRWQALILIAATIIKVFIYDVSQLDRVYRILSFGVLGVLLLAISFAYQRDWLKLSTTKAAEQPGS